MNELRGSAKRIRVACNTCRKKKIRCDGATRCVNCVIAQEPECVYDEKPPRQERKKTRVSKSDDSTQSLHSRLDKLENMLMYVVDALTKENGKLVGGDIKDMRFRKSSEEDDDSIDDKVNDEEKHITSSPSAIPDAPKANEIYLGNHSFFSILSKSSLNWMRSHLSDGNEHLLVPLTNLPYVFNNKTKRYASMWLRPKVFGDGKNSGSLGSPLPKNKEIVTNLVSKYNDSVNAVQILCSLDEIELSIKKYYSSSHAHKRNLQITEIFKLCSAILICLGDAIESMFNQSSLGHDGASSAKSSGSLSLREMSSLRDQLIEVCMGYFYQLSVSGQGLETVKSLQFFVVFLSKCNEPPDIVHLVLNQAIRKALDMGLHRIETYRSCSREDFETRLLVWKTACYLDMELCFRGGKPPVIHYSDVSEELRSGASLRNIVSQAYSLPLLQNYDMLFQVRLETYNKLFSAAADTSTFMSLKTNVDYLNDRMFDLLARISPDYRPYFYNQPGFSPIITFSNIEEEQRATMILTYFVNMMTINRLPMMFGYVGVCPELLQVYKNLSLNSARSILHLLKNFQTYGPGKAPSLWITYFPVIAVLHLSAACMSDSKSPDAYSDMTLVLEICETWFNRKLPLDTFRSFRFDMSVLVQFLIKCVTNIAVSIFEMNTGVEITANNEKIKELFDTPRVLFPELFGSAESLQKSIPLIFESKSPFPNDACPSSKTSPCSLSNFVDSHGSGYHASDTSSTSESQSGQNLSANYNHGLGMALNGIDDFLITQSDEFSNFFFDGLNGEF